MGREGLVDRSEQGYEQKGREREREKEKGEHRRRKNLAPYLQYKNALVRTE